MSELRQDPVSQDWVIIAPNRAKRPDQLSARKGSRVSTPREDCPFEFEALAQTQEWPPFVPADVDVKMKFVVVPNKFPIVNANQSCDVRIREKFYVTRAGAGHHNLLITRDHNKNFLGVDVATAQAIFAEFQNQYRAAAKESCHAYLSTFCNWGPLSGASIWHPHYQMISLPVLPPHVARSLRGSEAYFRRTKHCVRCDIIRNEKRIKKRIVGENNEAIAIVRYTGKSPFEINILPKRHASFFEKSSPAVVNDVVELVRAVMKVFKKKLNDPDLNFFIHSAPLDGKPYAHHHWHVELLPKLSTAAGLEFSTEIYVNSVDPDDAAAILKGAQ